MRDLKLIRSSEPGSYILIGETDARPFERSYERLASFDEADVCMGSGCVTSNFFFSLNSILASPLIDIDQTLSKKRHNFNFFDTQLTDRISMFQKKFRF